MVGVGSAAGGLLRRFLAGLEEPLVDMVDVDTTVSTFIINVLGSFAIGMLAGLPVTMISERMLIFFGPGMVGGFTALSAFSVETMLLLRSGDYWLAFINVVVSALSGFAAAGLGFALSHGIWPS